MAIAVGLALLDFVPVAFLALGMFFLVQLVGRLEPRAYRMALAGLLLVALGGAGRVISNLAYAALAREIPPLSAALYVFCGPGLALLSASLIRARGSAIGRPVVRDPWLAPTAISWFFLLAAFYLHSTTEDALWSDLLFSLAGVGYGLTCLAAAGLGWRRQLHMAAALFVFAVAGLATTVAVRWFAPQSTLIQLFGEILNGFAQAAFAFASWRVAAEYEARVGPTASR